MITDLSVENFKCYKSLDYKHLAQINILAGLNGRGKSSFLQSLLLLAQSYDTSNSLNFLRIYGQFLDLGTFYDLLYRNSKEKTFSIKYKTDDSVENELDFSFGEYPDKPTLAETVSIKVNRRELGSDIATSDDSDNSPIESTQHKTFGVTSSLAGLQQLQNIYYIVADRKGPQNNAKLKDDLLPTQIGLHGEYLINTLSTNKDKVSEITKALSNIMHGAYIHTESLDKLYINLLLDSNDESKGFMPVNVGFGYSYVLPVIMTLILAEDNSKIFIENPEAHLHPGAQSRLLEFMVQQSTLHNYQLFIETHSDHIINGIRIAIKKGEIDKGKGKILYFDKDEKDLQPEVTEINIDKDGNLSNYPKGFMEEWTNQMVELM